MPKQPTNSSSLMLSAAALSESVFCARAGILTLESRADDRIDEPAFDVTAIYELQVLEAAIVRSLWIIVAGITGVVLSYVAASMIALGWLWLVCLITVIRLGKLVCTHIATLIRLLATRHSARKAHCAEPDRNLQELQRVTWWGLLNMGFESLQYNKALSDSEWNLCGKPWRVLRRGSLRVPVFRTRSESQSPSQQSISKIMAYCYLLEKCEGFDSPYGIVLMSNTYRGFAVPNGGRFPATLQKALREFRIVAANAELRQLDPPRPADARKCSACPWGQPRRVNIGRQTVLNDQAIRPYVLRKWHEAYHCDCGDRFRWKPPHNDNTGLSESG
jgi:hypothetical protein